MRDASSLWPPPFLHPRQPHKGKGAVPYGTALFHHSLGLIYNGGWLSAESTNPAAMSNATSPRTIYLPSSGGYTSSRIVPEVSSPAYSGVMEPKLISPRSPSTDAGSRSADTVSTKTEASSAGPVTLAEKRTSTSRHVPPHV